MASLVGKVVAVAGAGIIAGTVGAVSAELLGHNQQVDLENISLEDLLKVVKDPTMYSHLIMAIANGQYNNVDMRIEYQQPSIPEIYDDLIRLSNKSKPVNWPLSKGSNFIQDFSHGILRIDGFRTIKLNKANSISYIEAILKADGNSSRERIDYLTSLLSESNTMSVDISLTKSGINTIFFSLDTGKGVVGIEKNFRTNILSIESRVEPIIGPGKEIEKNDPEFIKLRDEPIIGYEREIGRNNSEFTTLQKYFDELIPLTLISVSVQDGKDGFQYLKFKSEP